MFSDIKRKIARKCLDELLEAKDPEIYKDLAVAAGVIAGQRIMQWLDAKRIGHCRLCPSTDQLLSANHAYYCRPHFPAAAKSVEADPAGAKKNGVLKVI